MSFTDPKFEFVELTQWEYYNTAIYCVSLNLIAFILTSFITSTTYQLFVNFIVPVILLAACCEYLVLLKTRNHYYSVIGFLFFLYLWIFFGYYYLDHSRNIESNDGVIFLWALLLIVGYLMLPQLVIEKLRRQEGKPPIIKGFIKTSDHGTSANRRSFNAMILVSMTWVGFFILRIIEAFAYFPK